MPEARTIIDIGGQDSKLVRLRPDGAVADFVMNDRCAAGTGRFLEVLATRLGVKLTRLGSWPPGAASRPRSAACAWCLPRRRSSACWPPGLLPEDIVAGVQASIATRVAAMAGRNLTAPIIFTGGVALVPGMEAALRIRLGQAGHRRPATADDRAPGGRHPRRAATARFGHVRLLRAALAPRRGQC